MASNTEINETKKSQLLSSLDDTITGYLKHEYWINHDIITNYKEALNGIDLSQDPSSITWPSLELRDDNFAATRQNMRDLGFLK
tara:strand:- start:92 stop:343 length:252 start_codon:yes stop_codon:yes gene_type:complete